MYGLCVFTVDLGLGVCMLGEIFYSGKGAELGLGLGLR